MSKIKKELIHLVLNNNQSTGFMTTDGQLAYETRKGADTNLADIDGTWSKTAEAFCKEFSNHEDCTRLELPKKLLSIGSGELTAVLTDKINVMVDDDKSDTAIHGGVIDMVIRNWRKAMTMLPILNVDVLFLDYYLDKEASITGMDILFELLLDNSYKVDLPRQIVFISSDKTMSDKMQKAAIEHGPYEVFVDHKYTMDRVPYQLLAVQRIKKEG